MRTDKMEATPSVWRCATAIFVVKLLLRARGLADATRLIRQRAERTPLVSGHDAPPIQAIAHAVAMAAALYPGRAMCLEQSLTLYYFVRRAGIPARLRVGVQSYPFAAHAWVECDGEPINEFPEYLRRFAVLPDMPL